MDIRQISYFLAIAKTQNYSHAAKSLFISQPALKQSISKMEDELNTQLFIYHNHKLHLTESGQLLLEKGEPLVRDFNQLIFDLQNKSENERKSLTIGVTFLTMLQFIDQISRFIRQNPTIDVRIVQEGSIKLQHLLAQEKIDVGILSFPQVEHNIIIDPVAINHSSYSTYLVVPDNHPLASKKKVVFKDLKDSYIASLSDHFALGELTKKRCRELGILNQVILTHDDFEILLHSLHKLNAVTILPGELKDLSLVENLVWIPLHDVHSEYKQGLAYRKDMSHNSLAITQFIDAIKHH
ncbi:LysR family transcriptional regulator [Streptococcus pacificus]|uniref:LysR family transcriptional regulator n=1 Tax=Streptococcus pacificus TaxID=2740577 RepID=A0ABS0ZGZ4_9STRE|nr:LysR family transcriptional regulator [Streptococcus pacificus]MBJ8325269.1 LysR family transcriptional regulator [Streptococcus pacificus]